MHLLPYSAGGSSSSSGFGLLFGPPSRQNPEEVGSSIQPAVPDPLTLNDPWRSEPNDGQEEVEAGPSAGLLQILRGK